MTIATLEPGTPRDRAIPALIDRFGGRLYHAALRLCGSPQDAEDVVQETFLSAYRAWDGYEGRAPVGAWLMRIAANACRRMHRRDDRRPRAMSAAGETSALEDPRIGVAGGRGGDPLACAIDREMSDAVRAAIVELPAEYRLPLVFKDLLELSVQETAEALGLKPATVKTRVHRARMRLRDALAERLPREPMPPAAYSRRVCLDLLRAKQDALDRGEPFPLGDDVVCDRCQAVFGTLDLTHRVCGELASGKLPRDVARRLEKNLRQA